MDVPSVRKLVTNALQHARPASRSTQAGWPIQLGLLHPGHRVICAVADTSKAVPALRKPDFLDESGRGLHVIAALSDQWGCTTADDAGKVVWALFRPRLEPPVTGRPRQQHRALACDPHPQVTCG